MACSLQRGLCAAIASVSLGIASFAMSMQAPPAGAPLVTPGVVDQMRADAVALQEIATSDLAKQFLKGAVQLPPIEDRQLYFDPEAKVYLSPQQAAQLPPETQKTLKQGIMNERVFYYTKYDTPLAYVRAIELIGQAGIKNLQGAKVLDFGYGTIGHLRMMASQGGHVVGLDVDTMLAALYSQPGDTGEIKNEGGASGSITLLHGRLNEPQVKDQIGAGYDIIMSKNTLKRGYVHPPAEEQVDPRQLVDLGLDDGAFVKAWFDMLKPGGIVMIYNLSPKEADVASGERYLPWADGRCPFERDVLEKAGFEIVQYNADDSEMARKMAGILGWDKRTPPMDLENNLFGLYTILRKPIPAP